MGAIVVAMLVVVAGCSTSPDPTSTPLPPGEAVPESLDGLWILENSDLNIDIDIETAQVDGRTGCARLLGSLTFENEGEITSFSLPGRDDRSCSDTEVRQVDELQDMLQAIESSEAEAGGYQLLDSDGVSVGRLRVGS